MTYKQQPPAAAADSSTHDYLETGGESAKNIILESHGQSHADSRKAQQKNQSPGGGLLTQVRKLFWWGRKLVWCKGQRHEFELRELRESARGAWDLMSWEQELGTKCEGG